jgi:hypothetical protein
MGLIKRLFIGFQVFAYSLLSINSFSQYCLEDIDLNRIPQKKIRNFILAQEKNHVNKFSQIEPSWEQGQDMSSFHDLESTYIVKDSLEKVWELYKSVSPAISWNGRIISFGLLFVKGTNFVMYHDDNTYSRLDTGQVFYVNLKLLLGIYNLAVGLEIVGIDSVNKSIRFSYIHGGKSEGEQTIHFVNFDNGYTKIIHSTAFKSDSKFRDRYLYPHFHKKSINEFHHNILMSQQTAGKLSSPKKNKHTTSDAALNL